MCDLPVISQASLFIHSGLQGDALSELFVAWDDVLAKTENKATKLERDREERQRVARPHYTLILNFTLLIISISERTPRNGLSIKAYHYPRARVDALDAVAHTSKTGVARTELLPTSQDESFNRRQSLIRVNMTAPCTRAYSITYHADNSNLQSTQRSRSHPLTLPTFDLRSKRIFGSKTIHLVSDGINK